MWYDKPARIRQLQGLSMEQLQREILQHFPARLGHITPVAAGAFPLTRRHALQYAREGLALVGDAAHTIHPAGQGVNLGYRDVDALLDVLGNARAHAEAGQAIMYSSATRRDVWRITSSCSRGWICSMPVSAMIWPRCVFCETLD